MRSQLATLIVHRFAERDPATRRYSLGMRLFQLGPAAIHDRGQLWAAQPQLKRSPGRHVGPATFKVGGPWNINMWARVGGRAPCHATSLGKQTAWAPHDLLAEVRAHQMPPCTPYTITPVERFGAELAKVRAKGFALDLEEYSEAPHCVAAPVHDQTSRVVSELGIAGPCLRNAGKRLTKLTRVVVQAVHQPPGNVGFVADHSPTVVVH